MKGIVFTEFLEMVESRMGLPMVDQIIDAVDLTNDGAYTSVGTYDHHELIKLTVALSKATDIPVPDLVRLFGEHLFQRFGISHPRFFTGVNSTFDFLKNIENYIHVEVRKLYPDAELPAFSYENTNPQELVVIYRSPRQFGDLAEGLIRGCIAYFKEPIVLTRTDLPPVEGDQQVRFHLALQAS